MDQFDYIVVGGGSGGCAVAGRLSEDASTSVCLLEAGGDGKSWLYRMPSAVAAIIPTKLGNYGYETVPQPGLNGRKGYQPRGKALGGSSAINAMLYVRGHPGDYDEWRDLGCTGWGFDDVLPLFKRAEGNTRGDSDFHSGTGPLSVSDQRSPHAITHAFVEAGREVQLPVNEDFNGERQEGVGLYQVTQKDGERCSAAAAYIHPHMSRPNLDVRTKSKVERVIFEQGRAVGVVVDGKTIRARREIILAGGAFNTPDLLMRSGIGPAAQLKEHGIEVVADRAEVGENLQDHIDYIMAWKSDRKDVFGISGGGTMDLLRGVFEWRNKRTGPLTTPFAEGGAFLKSTPDQTRPDLQLHFVCALVDDHLRKTHLGHGFSCHVCLLRPKSLGTVRLEAGGGPKAKPIIDMGFLTARSDMDTMITGYRKMRQIMEAGPLAPWRGKELYTDGSEDDAQIEQIIRDRADTVYHPVGTCRMGSDEASVVDPQLRVRGVDGLRIADASIMPRIIGGNTNAPTIMIGEKCADLLRAA
ncbi:GMC family oxidoreductase N-terminal domain-containing protein [Rhizobiaceae bacterium]|nr:GMC family oxidoreductase N-terminal domain-containing protein [Rhizobiaceae bacterium]